MPKNIKKEIKKQKNISYTNKDFTSLRSDLERHMLTHFSDNIIDFSDSSLGGLFLDLGAYVGDVMSYYLDHQFNENSIENAIEPENLERLIRESGVDIPGASPAFSEVKIRIVVNSELNNQGLYQPKEIDLPVINSGTIFTSPEGIDFTLLEDVDFSQKNEEGLLIAEKNVGLTRNNNPVNYVLTRTGVVSSSKTKVETFAIEDRLIPFRTISLSQKNVNEIVSVIDSQGDQYYEVDTLSQDTVFLYYENTSYDSDLVNYRMELQHAPKRFVKVNSRNSGLTTLRFGSGNEDSFDEDIIPDPSEHAIKMYGDRETLNSVTIDPNSFLETQTLGISPKNTTLTVTYKYDGGLSHNVSAGSINSVKTLFTTFKTGTSPSSISSVRSSLTVTNLRRASGGEDEPSLEELRNIAIFNRNSQNRIVTREDLIARVYSMPANFGRVYRVAVSDNPNNPIGAQIFVISRKSRGYLTTSSDTLKKNLVKYLNKFRIVSDSIDILDAAILNFGINFSITIEKGYVGQVVVNAVTAKLRDYFDIKKNQINKPIVEGEIRNLILNVPGVVSEEIQIVSKSGLLDGNSYSGNSFSPANSRDRGFIFPPVGGIFELKYPNEDINGSII